MTLSVCMIVRDEAETLARCLNSVKPFADEIIVVDTGSTDETVTIARSFTDKVFFFEWCDDFSAARNFSFSHAGSDLVMWLDADDIVSDGNAAKIYALKNGDVPFDVAFVKYAVAFDGETPEFVYYRERIFRRALNLQWQGEVHEAIDCSCVGADRIIYSDACVFHKKVKANPTARNLRIYQKIISSGRALDARQKFYYGRELFFNGLYTECIAVLSDYMKGGGWVENRIEACRTLYKAHANSGRLDEGVKALVHAFTLSYPRAEDCCYLAGYFESKKDVGSAIYWYQCALRSPERAEDGGFINLYFQHYFPAIRLCVLYDGLGEYELANEYNEVAGEAKPTDEYFLRNRQYLKTKLSKR